MFDLVFIDADKQNYNLYFDLIIDKVNSGVLLLLIMCYGAEKY